MGPTHVKINHPNLIHNVKLLKRMIGVDVKLMTVVKANAYGHGMIEVARTLEKEGSAYFAVAFPEEGLQLRRAGIKTAILVMGAHLDEDIALQVDNNLDITITRTDQLEKLNSYCMHMRKNVRIHFKINTGMNRVGLDEKDFFSAFRQASAYPNIEIGGVYSHLSSSDEVDQSYTQKQLQRFRDIRDKIKNEADGVLFHLANSAAIVQNPAYHLDMVRAGIMLYGNPSNPDFNIDDDFREVMSFHTKIVLIREAEKDQPVSYSRRYYTKGKTRIAVLPVGYSDGYNRALTNKGFVLIQGKRYPLAGTVCMNHVLIDIGQNPDIMIGEDVVLFGKQGDEQISISEIARQLNTIPYEVTCWISSQVDKVHQY